MKCPAMEVCVCVFKLLLCPDREMEVCVCVCVFKLLLCPDREALLYE